MRVSFVCNINCLRILNRWNKISNSSHFSHSWCYSQSIKTSTKHWFFFSQEESFSFKTISSSSSQTTFEEQLHLLKCKSQFCYFLLLSSVFGVVDLSKIYASNRPVLRNCDCEMDCLKCQSSFDHLTKRGVRSSWWFGFFPLYRLNFRLLILWIKSQRVTIEMKTVLRITSL